MKTKNILLILGVLLAAWIGVGSQIPTILPVSPVTEFVDFLKGMRATGPLEVGPLGRSLKVWWNFEDFVSQAASLHFGSEWESSYSGPGAWVFGGAGTASRPGFVSLYTGTTTTGRSGIFIGGWDYARAFLFGAGVYTIEIDFNIDSLSTVAETYTLRFGFGDVVSADFVDGAYFEYSDVGSTPNWYKCTASNSTRTKTDTTVAAASGVWTRLKIVVNAAGTSVEYFINGTSAGVVTTNIPTGTGRETGGQFYIIKSAGVTPATLRADWIWTHIDLATSR